MHYEIACKTIRCDIAEALLLLSRPSPAAAWSAACATRDISAALHNAAGRPDDPLWAEAIASLRAFLDYCSALPSGGSTALARLRGFLEENADAAPSRMALAS